MPRQHDSKRPHCVATLKRTCLPGLAGRLFWTFFRAYHGISTYKSKGPFNIASAVGGLRGLDRPNSMHAWSLLGFDKSDIFRRQGLGLSSCANEAQKRKYRATGAKLHSELQSSAARMPKLKPMGKNTECSLKDAGLLYLTCKSSCKSKPKFRRTRILKAPKP